MEYPVINKPAYIDSEGMSYLIVRGYTKYAWIVEYPDGDWTVFGAPIGAYFINEAGFIYDAIKRTIGEKPIFQCANASLSAQLAALDYVSY